MAESLEQFRNELSLMNERQNNWYDDTALKIKAQGETTSSIQTDVKEILKILKGDGYSIPGLVSRVITLESQVRVLTVLVTIVSIISLLGIIVTGILLIGK